MKYKNNLTLNSWNFLELQFRKKIIVLKFVITSYIEYICSKNSKIKKYD